MRRTCPERPEPGTREKVECRDYDGSNPQGDDDGQVDDLRLDVTVKGVVQPRHEGAHRQEWDAAVVESEKLFYRISNHWE